MTFDKLAELYFQRYLVPLVTDGQIVKDYDYGGPQDKDRIIAIYTIRNEIFNEKHGRDNENFKKLVEELENFEGDRVVIHVYNADGTIYLIFTDEQIAYVIGKL